MFKSKFYFINGEKNTFGIIVYVDMNILFLF